MSTPTMAPSPAETPSLHGLAAAISAQARDLEDRLQLLFLDYDTCTRHGQPVDLPEGVKLAMTTYHPYYSELLKRMRQQLSTHLGVSAPTAEDIERVERESWTRGAEDVPGVVVTGARRTTVDWAVAVLASNPAKSWSVGDIHAELQRCGWRTTSPNPANLIANALTRAASQRVEVRRVRRGVYTWQQVPNALPAADMLAGDLPVESPGPVTVNGETQEAAMR